MPNRFLICALFAAVTASAAEPDSGNAKPFDHSSAGADLPVQLIAKAKIGSGDLASVRADAGVKLKKLGARGIEILIILPGHNAERAAGKLRQSGRYE